MSDNTKVGFFNNPEIPDSIKLGAVALLLNGTYDVQTSINGKDQTFISMVYTKNGGKK